MCDSHKDGGEGYLTAVLFIPLFFEPGYARLYKFYALEGFFESLFLLGDDRLGRFAYKAFIVKLILEERFIGVGNVLSLMNLPAFYYISIGFVTYLSHSYSSSLKYGDIFSNTCL